MSTFVQCSQCQKEIWAAEEVIFPVQDHCVFVCSQCEVPRNKKFIQFLNGGTWITRVSDAAILELISHRYLNVHAGDPVEYNWDREEGLWRFDCLECGRDFESKSEELLYPICSRCDNSPEPAYIVAYRTMNLFECLEMNNKDRGARASLK